MQVCGPSWGCSSVLAAMIGLSLLLCSGVLAWRDCLGNAAAWDTLVWFAALIGMSTQVGGSSIWGAWRAEREEGCLQGRTTGEGEVRGGCVGFVYVCC